MLSNTDGGVAPAAFKAPFLGESESSPKALSTIITIIRPRIFSHSHHTYHHYNHPPNHPQRS